MKQACDTCAFRPGSVTHDAEPYNALRGILCALGAVPFYCHKGVDWHNHQAMIQSEPRVRRWLVKAFGRNGPTLHHCEGWKEAVRRYKAQHLFDDPAIRRLRHLAADRALEVIEQFIAAPDGSQRKADLNRELEGLVYLLATPPEKTLREKVSELMVEVHLIPRELADYHVAAMKDDEISHRLRMYSEMELSAAVAKNRVGPISTRFLDPRQRRHDSRHSVLFPSSRPSKATGINLPELEVKNRVRSAPRAVSPRCGATFRTV